MVLTSDLLLNEHDAQESIEAIRGDVGCAKRHESARRGHKNPLSNEVAVIINKEIENCPLRLGGANACCAHDPLAIRLLEEQLNKMEETEETESMLSFLENHRESMEALDGIRIAFECDNLDLLRDEMNNFNDFVRDEGCYLDESEIRALYFAPDFYKRVTSETLEGVIKIREFIFGKKVEEIRDYILEYNANNESDIEYIN